MKTALVTGGAGFIGKNLVRNLIANGRRVIVVDNLSSSTKEGLPEEGDNFLFLEEDIEYFLDNITPAINWEFDEIYHLASPVGPVGVRN